MRVSTSANLFFAPISQRIHQVDSFNLIKYFALEPEEYDIDDEDSSYTASSEEIERSRSDERFKLSKQRPPPITL